MGTRRWLALGAVMLSVLAVSMDITVLNVALPTLSADLKAPETQLQWFSSAYTLVLAAMMLPAGLLGDRYGRKKVMLFSLALFAAGSLACACSRTPAEFIAARILLGFAGAGVGVLSISALTVMFSDEERPKALGIWAAVNLIAVPIGPILGGWLLSHYWWGWVFLMNVPAALLGFAATAILVPESASAVRPRIDAAGVVSSSAGLAAVIYGFIYAGEHGWGSAGTIAWLLVGLAALLAFYYWERALDRRPGGQPLVELRLFRSPSFTWGSILYAVLTLALVGLLFLMPQYFQGVLGTTAQGSGVRLLPAVGGLLLGVVPSAAVAKAIGAKLTVAIGFAILCAGLALGATTTLSSGQGFTAAWLAIAGAGTGFTLPTAASAALSELSEDHAGVGSGVLQALKNAGAPLGSAVLGTVLSSAYVNHLALPGYPPSVAAIVHQSVFGGVEVAGALHSPVLLTAVRAAFVHGVDVALVVSAGSAAAGMVLSLLFLPARPHPEGQPGQDVTGETRIAA
jgi:MFS transporter, DHA2 family, multidrug resistance protein